MAWAPPPSLPPSLPPGPGERNRAEGREKDIGEDRERAEGRGVERGTKLASPVEDDDEGRTKERRRRSPLPLSC